MKNKRIILFIFLFAFAFNCIKAQKKDSTLFPNLFRIIINPLLMVSQLELGGLVEFPFRKKISLEAGGGIHPQGYTIRTGLRFYLRRRYYLNPVFFYRHLIKPNERDAWAYSNNDTLHGHIDPKIINLSDNIPGFLSVTAYDNKQVLATEFLVGREFYGDRRTTYNVYFGIGYRYKYKVF